MLRRLEVVCSRVHLAAERQSDRPAGQLQQDCQEFVVGQSVVRNFDGHFVVAVEDNRNATHFESFDRRREQISRSALHNILDEGAEPAAIGFPLPACIVHELYVGRRVFELGRNQASFGIGDLAPARQSSA